MGASRPAPWIVPKKCAANPLRIFCWELERFSAFYETKDSPGAAKYDAATFSGLTTGMTTEHPDQKALAELLARPYSVQTQSEIARLLNKGGSNPDHNFASEEHFERTMHFLSVISSKIVGVEMSVSHSLASAVLGRICVTSLSVQDLFRGHEAGRLPFLDHVSIAILCRSIIEASIMYWYLMEVVDDEEWAFRYQVLCVHDGASRVRLFKPLVGDTADNQREILKKLREELSATSLFKRRPEQQRAKLRAGETLYVNGMRSVVASMNFDEQYFDSIYNYLSAYTHTSPLSYFRDGQDFHAFDEEYWRRTFAQIALHHAWIMMLRVALREMDASSLQDHFDPELVKEARRMASIRPQSAA